jgi:hypothetical protein
MPSSRKLIRTVRGMGYVLEAPIDDLAPLPDRAAHAAVHHWVSGAVLLAPGRAGAGVAIERHFEDLDRAELTGKLQHAQHLIGAGGTPWHNLNASSGAAGRGLLWRTMTW